MGRYRFDDEVLKNRHKPKTTKKPQKLKEKALTIYKEKNWYKIKLKNVCDLFWSSGTFRSNPAEWPAAWPSKLNDRWSRRKIITTMESGSDERSVTIETFSPLPNWVAVNRPSQSQDMCIGVRVYVCMLICACVCVLSVPAWQEILGLPWFRRHLPICRARMKRTKAQTLATSTTQAS